MNAARFAGGLLVLAANSKLQLTQRDQRKGETYGGMMQTGKPADAQRMLDLFGSVGATHFAVTLKSLAGEKEEFRRSVSQSDLRSALSRMLADSTAKQRSVIVRPH